MLEVDGVEVRYGAHVAVDGVSLAVTRGEVVCLLGASGSGKTSLLRAVAGLEVPARGRIRWDGRDVTAAAPHQRGFGMVFQDFALFPHRDVGANVAFGLRMQGGPHSRIQEVLRLVGLEGYERRMPATLSGGEMQRVALARALAPAPRVLLMDEPLGSLDRALRERLTGELRSILRELDIAVVHVTHDQQEALAIADRVVILRDGAVAQAGTPVDVWRRPADALVAAFLGFANLVPGDDGITVIPPDAVTLAHDGLPGTATATTFRGTGFVVTVELDAGYALEVPVRSDAVPAIGARVAVAVDPRLTSVVPPLP